MVYTQKAQKLKISRKFDMKNRQEFIKEVVQSCENCQKLKTLRTKIAEVIKTPDLTIFNLRQYLQTFVVQ